MNFLMIHGIYGNPDEHWYKWLRENFEPVDHIAYSYLVYEITEKDARKMRKKYERKKHERKK